MDALIFDFDGVIVDSEPIHLVSFAEVLRPMGVELGKEEYFQKYLGFDDYTCLAEALRNHQKPFTQRVIDDMVACKTLMLQRHLAESIPPIPGVLELIRQAEREGLPLAVCSGALREEIDIGLRTLGVRGAFAVIVAAEDVHRTKPDPEGYVRAARLLAEETGRTIRPSKCVALEDSPAGISSAAEAGMRVLAVQTSYPGEELSAADRVEADFRTVTLDSLRRMVK